MLSRELFYDGNAARVVVHVCILFVVTVDASRWVVEMGMIVLVAPERGEDEFTTPGPTSSIGSMPNSCKK
jgi:hypothetical protein